MKEAYSISKKNNEISIRIPINKHTVKRHNRLVSDYYFEAILLHGHVTKSRGLRVENDTSPLYGFEPDIKGECQLHLSLPSQNIPWMLFLKLSCHEGKERAYHPKHYGMKVVEVHYPI